MKRLCMIFLALLLSTFAGTTVFAQAKYPERPVKVLVPYAPGGATDIVARILGDAFQKVTGQPFVVVNKPGAFGLLAIDEMTKAAPDGYTLMIGNVSTNAITPIIYARKLTSDYNKSVVAVTNLIDVPAFMLVTTANNFPPKTLAEFIDYAKRNPGNVRYGTVGVGSYPHYDMAYFAQRAGNLDLVALPNKNGASGVIQDILRGDIQAAFLNVASTGGLVQAGKLRPLAVVNRTRLPEYPDLPTMTEAGFDGVGTIAWNGLFAPAATPKPVLEALFQAVNKAMAEPSAVAAFKKQHINIATSKSLDEARAWLAAEMKHWQMITSTVKIEAAN